jgi:hypothetical protein
VIDLVHALCGALIGSTLIAFGLSPALLQGIAESLVEVAELVLPQFAPRTRFNFNRSGPQWWLVALGSVYIAATLVAILGK